FSRTPEMLIVSRALLGIAGATLAPSTLSLIRNMFHDPRERTTAISVWIMAFSIGGAIGPLLGGVVLQYFWWGAVFLISVPVMILLLAVGPFLLPEYRDPNAGTPDVLSAALASAAVLSIIYGLKLIAQDGVSVAAALSVVAGRPVGGRLFPARRSGHRHGRAGAVCSRDVRADVLRIAALHADQRCHHRLRATRARGCRLRHLGDVRRAWRRAGHRVLRQHRRRDLSRGARRCVAHRTAGGRHPRRAGDAGRGGRRRAAAPRRHGRGAARHRPRRVRARPRALSDDQRNRKPGARRLRVGDVPPSRHLGAVGSRTLEGLNVRVEPVTKQLVTRVILSAEGAKDLLGLRFRNMKTLLALLLLGVAPTP